MLAKYAADVYNGMLGVTFFFFNKTTGLIQKYIGVIIEIGCFKSTAISVLKMSTVWVLNAESQNISYRPMCAVYFSNPVLLKLQCRFYTL